MALKSAQFTRANQQYARDASTSGLPNFNSHSRTYWVKFNSLPTSGQYYGLDYIGCADSDSIFYYRNNGGTLQFVMWITGANQFATWNTTLSTNAWYHIAIVCDGTNSRTVYLNGNSLGTNNYSQVNGGNINNYSIAVHPYETSNTLDGRMADVRIYNDILTQSEIQEIMTGSTSLNTFVSRYLDGTESWNDLIGSNHLTPYNSPTWVEDYPFSSGAVIRNLALLGVGK